MAKDLNKIYDFKIKKAVQYNSTHTDIRKSNPIKSHKDWEKSCFEPLKQHIKSTYYLPQEMRCAYCRKKLNANAYYDHIDHIIPKLHHKRWMFEPRNLAIACNVCNGLKGYDDTLSPGHSKTKFPNRKTGFEIFNPHFESWSTCFEVEEGMFIKGKTLRGKNTIKICKLFQDNFVVQIIDESRVKPKSAIKRATLRSIKFMPDTVEYISALKLIEYYTKNYLT